MARMYSRKKGKSGSKKPLVQKAPWVKYKAEELEQMIVKLAKKGYSSAKIGLALRDQYGVPSSRMVTKQKISHILRKNNLYSNLPEDLHNLLKKTVNLEMHMKNNKRDYTSKRGLEITESKIRKLASYYKKKGVLDKSKKLDLEALKLMVK